MAAGWIRLGLEAGRDSPERLEEALRAAGALAVTLEDAGAQPVLEPLPGETPLWPQTRVSGLFDAQTDVAALLERLRQVLAGDELPEYRLERLAERDWVRVWLEDFRPLRFGRRLWVCPHGQRPPEPAAVNVFLDPGLAFGTGTHPTTALCLEWLDGAPLTGRIVIDYGCGSGILAIAAARLGAARVWAVDLDPQALLAAERNAAANAVTETVAVVAPAALPGAAADVVIANILAAPLIELAPRFASLVGPGGRLVLSGILSSQAEAVVAAFADAFAFGPARGREDWLLLEAVRRD